MQLCKKNPNKTTAAALLNHDCAGCVYEPCEGLIPTLLTTRQAARALGVHEKTVRRRIQSGEIPATAMPGRSGKEYRIKEGDITKYIEAHS